MFLSDFPLALSPQSAKRRESEPIYVMRKPIKVSSILSLSAVTAALQVFFGRPGFRADGTPRSLFSSVATRQNPFSAENNPSSADSSAFPMPDKLDFGNMQLIKGARRVRRRLLTA